MDNELKNKIEIWLVGVQAISDKHWNNSGFTYAMPPIFTVEYGKRFAKIIRKDRNKDGVVQITGSVHAFIDLVGGNFQGVNNNVGDVLKPASFKTPAKHSRGNISDNSGGLACMGPYGPAYLR